MKRVIIASAAAWIVAITLLHGWLNNPDMFNWVGFGEDRAEEQFSIGFLPVT